MLIVVLEQLFKILCFDLKLFQKSPQNVERESYASKIENVSLCVGIQLKIITLINIFLFDSNANLTPIRQYFLFINLHSVNKHHLLSTQIHTLLLCSYFKLYYVQERNRTPYKMLHSLLMFICTWAYCVHRHRHRCLSSNISTIGEHIWKVSNLCLEGCLSSLCWYIICHKLLSFILYIYFRFENNESNIYFLLLFSSSSSFFRFSFFFYYYFSSFSDFASWSWKGFSLLFFLLSFSIDTARS